jgi:hypothetical protein
MNVKDIILEDKNKLLVVHIKDEYFEKMNYDVPNNGLMQNKENKHSRPAILYAYPHPDNKDLFLCIPMTTQVEKFKKIREKKLQKT